MKNDVFSNLSHNYKNMSSDHRFYVTSLILFIAVFVVFVLLIFALKIHVFNRVAFFDILLLGIATFRLSYLLKTDILKIFVKQQLIEKGKYEENHIFKTSDKENREWVIEKLISCSWCINLWTSAFFIYSYLLLQNIIFILASILTILTISDLIMAIYLVLKNRLYPHKSKHPIDLA